MKISILAICIMLSTSVIVVSSEETYDSIITVSQNDLKLDNEYAQYKIIFHGKDTIDVNIDMSYSVNTLDNLFYVVYLADGIRELTYKTFLRHEPTGRFDISFWNLHKKVMSKPTNESKTFDKTFQVRNNDVWYLTVVVYKSMGETIEVSLTSDNSTMEVVSSSGGNEMGYYTVQDGDFFGRCRGMSIFGLGWSRCNVHRSITFKKGTLFYYNVDNFLDSSLLATQPNGKTYAYGWKTLHQLVQKNTHYYEGKSETGKWTFSIRATSFPTKLTASVFFVDVNPYGKNNLWK